MEEPHMIYFRHGRKNGVRGINVIIRERNGIGSKSIARTFHNVSIEELDQLICRAFQEWINGERSN